MKGLEPYGQVQRYSETRWNESVLKSRFAGYPRNYVIAYLEFRLKQIENNKE